MFISQSSGLRLLRFLAGGVADLFARPALPETQVTGEVLLYSTKRLNVEVGLSGLRERVVQEGGNLVETNGGKELLGGLNIFGRDESDRSGRMAGALLGEHVRDLERLANLLPIVVRLPLQFALMPATVEPLVVLKECHARSEATERSPPRFLRYR